MKIKRIEFENFRNFRDHGEIRCSTDGRVTIIYGKNGDGKTTLHQLFQWIFYDKVNFNKTTTERLYNLAFEAECSFGEIFKVMGRIDFEHDGENYSLTRTYTYKKGIDDSAIIAQDIVLLKMNSDHDWKRLDHPQEVIEKLLPSGLSEYFFFDGEGMIADLRVKGRDSAEKLRKALYSMFDLDVLEGAISHIGKTDLKTTVMGKLYLDKSTTASGGGEIAKIKNEIEQAQNKISDLQEKIREAKTEMSSKKKAIQAISEEIGTTKSKADYERQRKELQKQRDFYLENAKNQKKQYGEIVIGMFPRLLISKAVEEAEGKLSLKAKSAKFPSGLNRRLTAYLLATSTKECICGTPLCDEQRKKILSYQDMLWPNSWTSTYNEFSNKAKQWGTGYDREKVEQCIAMTLQNNEYANKCDIKIHELDEAEKKSKDIEDLIVERQKAEERVNELESRITGLKSQCDKFELFLKGRMKEYDKVTAATEQNKKALHRLAIMKEVLSYFTSKLEEESKEYSRKLQENIQELLNDMLTSKRRVEVSESFAVRVIDSYKDESKSEGQFAVVSFAYIGGILRMLKSESGLENKEYPLVLDGPFSKLDSDQRQNVVDKIPEFAPQVILFSKDDLQEVFGPDKIGSTWTICSNDEKNVATVEEGFKWN